jgi:hypothetical protein
LVTIVPLGAPALSVSIVAQIAFPPVELLLELDDEEELERLELELDDEDELLDDEEELCDDEEELEEEEDE